MPAAPRFARRVPAVDASISRRRLWLEGLGVFALFFATAVATALFDVTGHLSEGGSASVPDYILGGMDRLSMTGLALVVVLVLSRRRGLTARALGVRPAWARHYGYRWQGFAVVMLFVLASYLSFWLMHLVTPDAHYPGGADSAWSLLNDLPAAIAAGVMEELVVLALFVTIAEQAGAKVWVIYAAGIALRLSYHVYYGPGVVMLAIWAAAALWAYRRTRRISVLIAAHIGWDAFVSIDAALPWNISQILEDISVLAVFVAVGIIVVRLVMVAVTRRRGPTLRVHARRPPAAESIPAAPAAPGPIGSTAQPPAVA